MQQQGDEVEVEAVQVLHKKLKFRTVQGSIFPGTLDVYECEQPYVLICKVTTEHEHSLRMDVHKDDLAAELRQWLEGKVVRNPVAFPPKRIDEAIQRFVKFGKAPLQEDLIMWILSRSELQWAPEAAFTFGGLPSPSEQAAALDLQRTATFEANAANLRENPLARTVDAALKSGAYATDSDQYRVQGAYGSEEGLSHLPPPQQLLQDPETAVGAGAGPPGRQQHGFGSASVHLKKAAHLRASSDGRGDNPLHMARQLIGTSAALAQLKSSHHAKGSREGAAREVLDMSSLTPYHWKLASEIEKARKEVEEVMDQRRKEIEIARARKKATQDKFSAIRKTVDSERTGGSWYKVAEQELSNLRRVRADIADDLQRQRNRAHREAQKVRWTTAPSGIGSNRAGKSAPGVVIGPGPIPNSAMHRSEDPQIERAVRRFYWDSAGRRHVRQEDADANGSGSGSIIDQAMDAIRKAAKAGHTSELDLRSVFADFDSSGNGSLSIEEMQMAFVALGVRLDVESLVALFSHFDPNGSGEVQLGEFVWAFFNRRGLVRQWRRKTDRLTDAQIRAKFHAADTSGDGKLSPKEFGKFLKSFGVAITAQEQATLMEHFDSDGDGTLDLEEFKAFIVSEMMRLNAESNNLLGSLGPSLPSPSSSALPSPPSGAGPAARPYSANDAAAVPVLPLDVPSGGGRPMSAIAHSGPTGGRSRSLIEPQRAAAELSPDFVAASLKAQHGIEQKLGHSYYP